MITKLQRYFKEMNINILWYRDNITRELSLSSLNINEVKDSVDNCTRCNLHKTRNNTVFGDGEVKSDIMIIGEAPGKDEDEHGKPFIGRAGKLLNQFLKSINLISNHINDLSLTTAFIGPSISQKNYEVGNEFIDYFGKEFIYKVDDKFFCNLKGIASFQLQKLGIKNIIDCSQCTYENKNYHSYRRDKTSKRMIGLIYYE